MSNQIAFDTITDQIIDQIESGMADDCWTMPWHKATGLPTNVASNKPYNGINIVSLWFSSVGQGFTSNTWGTFKQWKALECPVKKGSKGTKVVFWKGIEVQDKTNPDETKVIPMAKVYTVFNADQVDGYVEPESPKAISDIESLAYVDNVVEATGAHILHQGNQACYIPSQDKILMPSKDSFYTTTGYYSTLLHELAHWTGHASRLDRTLKGQNNRTEYAIEELIAELSAAFSCAALGITSEPRPDHAIYIKSWLRALKNDKKFIFEASKLASKATQYLMEPNPQELQDAA